MTDQKPPSRGLSLNENDLAAIYGTPTGPFIHRHSSLAYSTGLCVFLRERFSVEQGTPWKSAARGETGWVQDQANASIYILNEYDEDTEIENLYPRITVQHGQTTYGRIMIGDETTENASRITKNFKRGSMFGESAFGLEIMTIKRGESAILADLCAATIFTCTDILSRMMKVRQIRPPTISPTSRREGPDGKSRWRTEIGFSLEFEATWVTVPINPTLQAVDLNLRLAGALEDATRYIRAQASHKDT